MKKVSKEVVRFKGFNIESDAFTETMELLEADSSSAKKIISNTADMMLGGGAKSAFPVAHRMMKDWINRKGIVDDLIEVLPEMREPAIIGGAKFNDMLAKIMAKGLITDIYESPFQYRRFIDDEVFSQFEEIVQERGKQKFKNMLKNRGIVSKEEIMNNEKTAEELVKMAETLMADTSVEQLGGSNGRMASNLPRDRAMIRTELQRIMSLATALEAITNDTVGDNNAKEVMREVKKVKKALRGIDDLMNHLV